jgi:hypothetical protein
MGKPDLIINKYEIVDKNLRNIKKYSPNGTVTSLNLRTITT